MVIAAKTSCSHSGCGAAGRDGAINAAKQHWSDALSSLQARLQRRRRDASRTLRLHGHNSTGTIDGHDDARVCTGFLVRKGVNDAVPAHLRECNGQRQRSGAGETRKGKGVVVQLQVPILFGLALIEANLRQLRVCEGCQRSDDGGVDQVAAIIQHKDVDVHAPAVLALQYAQAVLVDDVRIHEQAAGGERKMKATGSIWVDALSWGRGAAAGPARAVTRSTHACNVRVSDAAKSSPALVAADADMLAQQDAETSKLPQSGALASGLSISTLTEAITSVPSSGMVARAEPWH